MSSSDSEEEQLKREEEEEQAEKRKAKKKKKKEKQREEEEEEQADAKQQPAKLVPKLTLGADDDDDEDEKADFLIKQITGQSNMLFAADTLLELAAKERARQKTPGYKLCLAARNGDLAGVKALVESGAVTVDPKIALKKGEPSYTPLHLAIIHGHEAIVLFLLEHDADVTVKAEEPVEMITGLNSSEWQMRHTRNAFHLAAHAGRYNIMDLLLGQRYPDAKGNFRDPEKEKKEKKDDDDSSSSSDDDDDDEDGDRKEKAKDKEEEAHHPIYDEDHLNHTVMSIAMKANKAELIRLMFSHGVDISGIPSRKNIENYENFTTNSKRSKMVTLLYAIKTRMPTDFIEWLLEHTEPDVDFRTFKGVTPLHIAARGGELAATQLLIAKGADVNALTLSSRRSPLTDALERLYVNKSKYQRIVTSKAPHLASEFKHEYSVAFKIVELLLANQASLKYARATNGQSPLFYAITHTLSHVVELPIFQQELNRLWKFPMPRPLSNLKRLSWWKRNRGTFMNNPQCRFWASFFFYFIFLVTLTILLLVANTDIHAESYYFTHAIKVRTVGEQFYIDRPIESRTGVPGDFKKYFADTDQIPEIWAWITGPFYLNFFAPETSFHMRYNKVVTNRVRLRQFRVEPDSCDLASDDYDVLAWKGVCYDHFSEIEEETAPYGPETSAFKHKSYDHQGLFPSTLENLFPESGGYEVTLNTLDANGTFNTLLFLINNNWLDELSRIITIEFTVYNANINLWCIVRLMWDMPRAGIVYPSSEFTTIRLYRYNNAGDWVIVVFEIAMFFTMLAYMLVELKEMVVERRQYLRNGWNVIDVSIYLSFIVYGIFRVITLGTLYSRQWQPDDDDDYESFNRAARYMSYEVYIASIIMVLSWFKLFKYLRIQKDIGILLIIIKSMMRDLLNWLAVFFFVTLSFSLAFFLLLGSNLWPWRSSYYSLLKMFLVALGDRDFDAVAGTFQITAIVLFVLYIVISGILLLNLLIAMLNQSYSMVANSARLQYLLQSADLVLQYTSDPANGRVMNSLDGNQTSIDPSDYDSRSDDDDDTSAIPLVTLQDMGGPKDDDDDDDDRADKNSKKTPRTPRERGAQSSSSAAASGGDHHGANWKESRAEQKKKKEMDDRKRRKRNNKRLSRGFGALNLEGQAAGPTTPRRGGAADAAGFLSPAVRQAPATPRVRFGPGVYIEEPEDDSETARLRSVIAALEKRLALSETKMGEKFEALMQMIKEQQKQAENEDVDVDTL